MTRRPAMTLIEVLLAITVGTAVVAMLATVVTRVVAVNATAQRHVRTVVTLGRLGEQLRSDVHGAHQATVEESNDQLLKLKGESQPAISYEITPAGLLRVAGSVDKPEHRELFALPGMKFLGWNLEDDGRTVSLAVGRLARPASGDTTVGSQFSLVALLARAERPAAASPETTDSAAVE